jgi:Glycosyltransferase family 87
MLFVQRDDMVENLAAAAYHPALRSPVLPRRLNSRALRSKARRLQKGNHIRIEFILYFAWKRQWRAVAGLVASGAGFAAVSLLLFGWADNVYFLSHILPRVLEGMTLDPFNSGTGTFSTLLRRAVLAEPELNPNPLLNLPFLYFFLQPFMALTVLSYSPPWNRPNV